MAYVYQDGVDDFRDIMRDPANLNNKMFSDREILRWFADANNEVVRELGLYVGTNTITSVVGTATYAKTVNTSKIVAVYNPEGDRLQPITKNELDASLSGWVDQSGTATHYYETRESANAVNTDIGFYPKPAAIGAYIVHAWETPEQHNRSNLTGTPDVHLNSSAEVGDMVFKLLLDYALAMGYRKKRDFTEYDKLYSKFLTINMKKIKAFFYRDEDRTTGFGTNETNSTLMGGRYPAGYPIFRP